MYSYRPHGHSISHDVGRCLRDAPTTSFLRSKDICAYVYAQRLPSSSSQNVTVDHGWKVNPATSSYLINGVRGSTLGGWKLTAETRKSFNVCPNHAHVPVAVVRKTRYLLLILATPHW
jgi:hypothetical protein